MIILVSIICMAWLVHACQNDRSLNKKFNNNPEIDYYLNQIKNSEKTGGENAEELLSYHLELAEVFRKSLFMDEAFRHLDKAEKLADRIGTDSLKSEVYRKVGHTFLSYHESTTDVEKRMAFLDSMDVYFNRSLAYCKSDQSLQYARSLISYGNVKIIENELEEAVKMFQESARIAQLHQNEELELRSLINLSFCLLEEENLEKAEPVLQQAKQLANQVGDLNLSAQNHYNISRLHKLLNNSDSAYQNLYDYAVMREESILNENAEKLAELNVQYNTAKEKEKAANSRATAIGLGGLLALSFSALLYFTSRHRYKRKNLQLELDRKEQDAQIRAINAMIDGREEEREQIGRTLHDSVTTLLTSANMHLEVLKVEESLENPLIEKTQTMLDNITDKVRNLSHGLLSDVLIKYGLAKALEDLCDQLTTKQLPFEFSTNLEQERFEKGTETKLFNIAQELCNNVLKHSGASAAVVELYKENNLLNLKVSDNGVGFDLTNNQPVGIGLNQIKARVSSMNGKLQMKSNQVSNTEILIELILPKTN